MKSRPSSGIGNQSAAGAPPSPENGINQTTNNNCPSFIVRTQSTRRRPSSTLLKPLFDTPKAFTLDQRTAGFFVSILPFLSPSSYHTLNLTMGKKTYFEFLEEEYQSLSSDLQSSLAASTAEEEGSISNNSAAIMSKQLSRCKAILQQLRVECRGDAEFKERVQLYKIQLDALQQHLEQQQSS